MKTMLRMIAALLIAVMTLTGAAFAEELFDETGAPAEEMFEEVGEADFDGEEIVVSAEEEAEPEEIDEAEEVVEVFDASEAGEAAEEGKPEMAEEAVAFDEDA